jgi:hypothetical protein
MKEEEVLGSIRGMPNFVVLSVFGLENFECFWVVTVRNSWIFGSSKSKMCGKFEF